MPSPDTVAEKTASDRIPRRVPAWLWIILLSAITLIGALLRFHAIGQKNVWVDEGVSIALARLDWYNFLRILWRHEANMTLYYLFLRAWLPFGNSEGYIRTLSALFGLATIPAVFVLGKQMFNARVGFVASLLLAVNAYAVRYSQEARSYSLYPLLCVLSSIFFLRLLENPSRRNRVAYVLTSVLSVYAHFFAGLLVVAQWIAIRLSDTLEPSIQTEVKKAWRHFAIAVAPLAIFIVSTGVGVLRWVPRPRFTDLRTCVLFLTGNGGTLLLLLYLIAIVAGTTVAFREGLRSPLTPEAWKYAFFLIWFVFPILFIFVISQLKPLFVIRYFVFTIPAVVLLAAAGLARIRPRVLLSFVVLIFALLSLRADESYYQKDFDIFREDWRSASRYVLANSQAGDVILFHQPLTRMPYEYYRSVTAASHPPTVIYPEHGNKLMFRDFYAGHAPDGFLAGLPAHYGRIWVALSYNQLPTGPDPTTRFISDVFARQYRNVVVQEFPGIEVRLYSTTPNHEPGQISDQLRGEQPGKEKTNHGQK